MTITNLTDRELSQTQRIAELEAEVERLKAAAKYAEHIDATPENQRETMLHDALTERNALRAQIETLQCDAERLQRVVLVISEGWTSLPPRLANQINVAMKGAA